jgi:hypothetical protein
MGASLIEQLLEYSMLLHPFNEELRGEGLAIEHAVVLND